MQHARDVSPCKSQEIFSSKLSFQKSQDVIQGLLLEQKTNDEYDKSDSSPKNLGSKELDAVAEKKTPPNSAVIGSREKNPDGELLRLILEKSSAFTPEQVDC